MEGANPDFSVVERVWESRLRERGLAPSRVDRGVATGLDGLVVYRNESQVAEIELDQLPGHDFIGALGIKVALNPPSHSPIEIRDLVTQRGPSLEGALERCANTFMDVTFPPLETLFTGSRPEGPGTGTVTLNNFSVELDRAIKWDIIVGPLQILGDPDGKVRDRLKEKPPITLILDTLIGHLGQPMLHCCKLYGENTLRSGPVLGCAIDGQVSPDGEAEFASKFGDRPPGEWEFRQFFVIRPVGDADETITAKLRAAAAEAFPKRKGLWSRLFGG